MIKRILGLVSIGLMLSAVGQIFWDEEFKHYKPRNAESSTLVPGEFITLAPEFIKLKDKPAFIHFYDNDCLFAKTNIDHLGLFTEDRGGDVDYYLILVGASEGIDQLQKKFNVPDHFKVVSDPDLKISTALGVNTTPQAVILDPDSRLYFKGNYTNQTGLCGPLNIGNSAPALALDAREKNLPAPLFPDYQTQEWGCDL